MKTGWGALGALFLLAAGMLAASWGSVAEAVEPGMEIGVQRSGTDNMLEITSRLMHVEPGRAARGTWTYRIEGIGVRTENEGCSDECMTFFNLALLETGREYTLNGDSGGPDGPSSGQREEGKKPSLWFLAPFVLAIAAGAALWIWVYRKM